MLKKIGNFECTEVWDGVFYKKLSNYPQISDCKDIWDWSEKVYRIIER